MKSSLIFFLLLVGMALCQIREYIFINEYMNWTSAQKYCRKNYADLAIITTDEEGERLTSKLPYGWIGLNGTATGSNKWQWSDGELSNFFMWGPGQPAYIQGVDNCLIVYTTGWIDASCASPYPFYCYLRFVLVEDSKTWEEALNYCRTYYQGLVSLIPQAQLALAETGAAQPQTVRLWTGLHFVNGQWVSVNMVPLGSLVSLPSCPASGYRCGAYNNNASNWENRDCSEKPNFICY